MTFSPEEHEDRRAESRECDDGAGDGRAHEEDDEGDGDEAGHLRGEDHPEGCGDSGDGFAFGEDEGDAAEEFEGAQGGEDGRDLQDRDERAVDESAHDADHEGDAQRDEDGHG